MGTSSTRLPSKVFDYQSLSVVWLDKNVKKTRENRELQNRFQKTAKLLVFKNLRKCEQHIKQQPESNHIILIINNTLGQQLVPSIHQLSQLLSVYVFCTEEVEHPSWAVNYEKVSSNISFSRN